MHSRNGRFWKLGLVFLAVFFVFFTDNKASAAIVDCSNSSAKFKCTVVAISGGSNTTCAEAEADCQPWCDGINSSVTCNVQPYDPATGNVTGQVKRSGVRANDDSVFTLPFKWLIYGMFKFCTWLLFLAGVIFGFIVDPNNVSFIMNNEGLYASWAMVRDFLNLGFILVLLYIAFCVIFQIGSYSDGWRKMLLMMVIMALLVNFSFPICRLIIDISNITFYYILNTGFSGSDSGEAIITAIANKAGLADILDAGDVSVTYLIAITVFTFIAAITFMVIAILFVVRAVAIGLLIIFSPIGFAGAAFPFSKKYASQWWGHLFNYAFFAPIMMFMILIATRVMEFSGSANFGMLNKAQQNLGPDTDPNFFGNMAFFSIPIVILWVGMGMAKSMSIMGAGAVTGGAERFAKWAGRQAYQMPWRGAKMAVNATGVPGGAAAGWNKFTKTGKLFGTKIPGVGSEGREAREAMIAGGMSGGRAGMDKARRDLDQKRINEKVKEMEEVNMSHTQVMGDLDPTSAGYKKLSELDRRAYAKYLVKKDSIGRLKNADELKNVLSASGDDAELMKDVIGKVKKANNRKMLIDFEMNHGEIDEKADSAADVVKTASRKTANNAYKAWLDGLNAEGFSKEKGLDPTGRAGADFRNYIVSNVVGNPARHQKIYGEMSVGSQNKWDSAGLTP